MSRKSVVMVGLVLAMLLASCSLFAMAAEKPAVAPVPSVNEQASSSRLGELHWNIFKLGMNNPEDPEQTNCMTCHSAVKIVDDPNAKVSDFVKAGQQFCIGESEVDGKTIFTMDTAKVDGKYVDNGYEGITCRVCHVMDKNGLTLRRPDNTCTLCHGRVFNWKSGSGHHVEQDFFEGHGDGFYDPSVHYTLGMQCEGCHTMNGVKHDYEPAKGEDIVKDPLCANCHKDAEEIEKMIEETKSVVGDGLKDIDARVKAAEATKLTDAQKALVSKAKFSAAFIVSDLSNGVHNPNFAIRLINEAFAALDKAEGKTIPTLRIEMDLMVYSQAQTSELGDAHWDLFERTIGNADDPEQDHCIACHSAVSMVDDPKAKVADFLPKGAKYCIKEEEIAGKTVFTYAETTQDGKYLKNRSEGITCRVCHTFNKDGNIGLRKTPEQTCGQCHGRVFNWKTGSGHHVELAFFKGQGDKDLGIADQPSMKIGMGFACQDCHFMDGSKHDFKAATAEQIAASENCKSCHTAAEIKETVEDIVNETKAGMAKLQPRLDAAKAWVDKNAANAEAKALYTQAQSGVNFIVSDMSNGVHNPEFASFILKRSGELLDKFEAKFK